MTMDEVYPRYDATWIDPSQHPEFRSWVWVELQDGSIVLCLAETWRHGLETKIGFYDRSVFGDLDLVEHVVRWAYAMKPNKEQR